MTQNEVQTEFNRLVTRGIVLGYTWIMGAGSVISLISAFQANKLIKKSGYELSGKDKVRKCLYIGIAGLLVWVIAISIIILFRKK